jgi:hypothetical protein
MSAVLLVGCSQEQDTRLICDCIKYREVRDEKVMGYLWRELEGTNFRTCDSEDVSLVFNESSDYISLDGETLQMPLTQYIPEYGEFRDEKFNIDFIEGTKDIYPYISWIILNRTTLIMEEYYYFPNLQIGTVDTFDQSGSALAQASYQCRVVDGV